MSIPLSTYYNSFSLINVATQTPKIKQTKMSNDNNENRFGQKLLSHIIPYTLAYSIPNHY